MMRILFVVLLALANVIPAQGSVHMGLMEADSAVAMPMSSNTLPCACDHVPNSSSPVVMDCEQCGQCVTALISSTAEAALPSPRVLAVRTVPDPPPGHPSLPYRPPIGV